MSYQYYETLLDKSKENLASLLEQIVPRLSQEELKIIITDSIGTTSSKKKIESDKLDKVVVFTDSSEGKNVDLTKLSEKELEVLYKTFISKELTNKKAVKWRFYQNLKIFKDFNIKEIKLNPITSMIGKIDFSVSTNDDQFILISCFDILDLEQYKKISKDIVEFLNKKPKPVNGLYFVTNRTYRNIPLDEIMDTGNSIIVPDIWVEWIEENRS